MNSARSIPVVASADCVLHEPSAEIWLGTSTPGTEVAERVAVIEATLRDAGHPFTNAFAHPPGNLTSVHDPHLVEYLETAWANWNARGYPDRDGAHRVVPYLFPTSGFLNGLPPRMDVAPHAQAGVFCYDTMTLIGPGTWEAALAAARCALTAADLVARDGGAVYALTRPPGHHATFGAFGGSCYLNNAALAAQRLRDSGASRVAVIDIDAHHGNGTQSIFYDRPDVFVGSVHVDPGAGWFPHHVGFANEVGRGAGIGATMNVPLPEGTGDDVWIAALARVIDAVNDFNADAIVVSLGVDAAVDDPESPLCVTRRGFERAAHHTASLNRPTVVIQEGGYHLATLGDLVSTFLSGLTQTSVAPEVY